MRWVVVCAYALGERPKNFTPWEVNVGMEVSVEIKLPDNLKNRSGVTEAKVTVTLRGLMTKTLTLTRDQIEKIQVPEGMRADILTQMLDVTFRGPASQLETLTAEDVTATVDFTGAKAGTYTLPLSFTINGTDRVGAYGNKYNVTVMLSADTTEPSEAETGE